MVDLPLALVSILKNHSLSVLDDVKQIAIVPLIDNLDSHMLSYFQNCCGINRSFDLKGSFWTTHLAPLGVNHFLQGIHQSQALVT